MQVVCGVTDSRIAPAVTSGETEWRQAGFTFTPNGDSNLFTLRLLATDDNTTAYDLEVDNFAITAAS